MKRFSDEELIQELQNRFAEHKYALEEQKKLMDKLKAVNQKLEKSEGLKSNFISNIRNEINNPFASILGISSNIISLCKRKKGDAMDKVQSMAALIHNEAFKLDFQLKNIFTAASIEAGEAMPEVAKVDLDCLIRDAIDYFAFRIHQREIYIHYTHNFGKDEPFYFKTDPDKLQLAILNLMSNALEFSKAGERIEITACFDKENDTLQVTIKDYGVGISSEDQKEIFDRFNQLDTGLTREHPGHGLGLSVTKALLELINGSISIESTRDVGSAFTISLQQFEMEDDVDDFAFGGNELFFDAEESF